MYKVHIKRTAIIAVIGLAVALAYAAFTPKIYQATFEVLLGQQGGDRRPMNMYTEDVQEILDSSTPRGLITERQFMNSQSVFLAALRNVGASQNRQAEMERDWQKYYRMFDVISVRLANQQEINAGIAQVRVRAYEPETALALAQQVYDQYNVLKRRTARDGARNAVAYLEASILSTEDDLAVAASNYSAKKAEFGIASFEARVMGDTTMQTELMRQLEEAQRGLSTTDAQINSLRTQLRTTPRYVESGSSEIRDPIIGELESERQSLLRTKNALLQRYTESSREIQRINNQLEDNARRLEEAMQNQYRDAQRTQNVNPVYSQLEGQLAEAVARRPAIAASVAGLESSLAEHNLIIAASPEQEVQLRELEQEMTILENRMAGLKTMLSTLSYQAETEGRSATLMGDPRVEEEPVAPEPIKLGLIGFIAGACAGLMLSFAMESMKPRVYSSAQLHDLTGLPVVGSVPPLPGISRARIIQGLAQPNAKPAEAFRYMAFHYLARGDAEPYSLLFTGIGAAGASSVNAASFAVACAKTGMKTILIDLERKNAAVSKGFDAEGQRGITDILKEGSVGEVMLETQHPALRVIPVGTQSDQSPSEVTPSRIAELVAQLKQEAQIIVVSTSACDVLADAAAMAGGVDEVCLTVSAKSNEYNTVPMAYDVLQKAGAHAISLILSDAPRDNEPFGTASTQIQRAG